MSGAAELLRDLVRAHLCPDPDVRAARLAEVERRRDERCAELRRQYDEAAAEAAGWRAVCERLAAGARLQ